MIGAGVLAFFIAIIKSTENRKIALEIERLAFNNKYSKIPRKLLFLSEQAKEKILGMALFESVLKNRLSSSILLQAFGADFKVKSFDKLDSLDLALSNNYWDIATSLISHSIVKTEFSYLEEKILLFYKNTERKKALIIFSSLDNDFRLKMINKHFGKLMNLSRNSDEYFKIGFKISQEKISTTGFEQIERNGYLALHWAKNKQMSNSLALLLPYLKLQEVEIISNTYLVYYFLGLCYFMTDSLSESLRSFEEVQKRKLNYFQTELFIKKIKERRIGDKESRSYVDIDLKSISYYETLGIMPNSTKEEIKKAYHKKIILYHPDKFATMGKEYLIMANEKSKELNEAYNQCIKSLKN